MTDESVLAVAAGPEDVAPETGEEITQTEGQPEGQAAEGADDAPADEKKSAAKERREREKARVAKLEAECQAAIADAERAEQRRQRILTAGQQERAPVESEYADPLEYVAAKAVWAAQQKQVERDAKEAEEAAAEQRQRVGQIDAARRAAINAGWVDQVMSAKERYADFEEVAFRAPIGDALADLIKASEFGADLAYHIGSDHKAAMALSDVAKINPVEAARQIGRLEATLSAPQPRKTTTAPPPISPVRGKATPTASVDNMSPEEFAKWRAGGGTFKLR